MNKDFSGVILDEKQAKALLYYAIKEDFISDNEKLGDGFIKNILDNPPIADVRDRAFEQLVIFKKIYVPFSIPSDVKSDLFESGMIVPHSRNIEKNVEIDCLDIGVITEVLRQNGKIATETDVFNRMNNFIEISKRIEYDKIAEKYETGEMSVFFQRMFQHIGLSNDNYIPDDIVNKLQELYEAKKNISDIIGVFDMFQFMLSLSIKLSAYCSLPNITSANLINNFDVKTTGEMFNIVRITCDKLGTTTVGRTLKETIELSETPEAEAYQKQLIKWSNAIHNGGKSYDTIINEIKRVQIALNFSKYLKMTGEVCTCVGVPAAFAAQLAWLSAPVAAVSAICLVGEKTISSMNKWAMLGKH